MTSPSSISIPELRKGLTGRVIAPGDDDYDEVRTIVYGGFDRRPAAIALVADALDVARVMDFARRLRVESPFAAAVTAAPATARRRAGSSSTSAT